MCSICGGKAEHHIKVNLTGFQPFVLHLCNNCKILTRTWYVAFCRECQSIELWNKTYYAPIFNTYPSTIVEVTLADNCLNCTYQFFVKQ